MTIVFMLAAPFACLLGFTMYAYRYFRNRPRHIRVNAIKVFPLAPKSSFYVRRLDQLRQCRHDNLKKPD